MVEDASERRAPATLETRARGKLTRALRANAPFRWTRPRAGCGNGPRGPRSRAPRHFPRRGGLRSSPGFAPSRASPRMQDATSDLTFDDDIFIGARAPSPPRLGAGETHPLDRAERGDDRDANAPTRPVGDRTATATATAIDARRPSVPPGDERARRGHRRVRVRARRRGALIAAPLHVAHDDDPSEWPRAGRRGDFDALGFDFSRTDAPSRDDEAAWIPNWRPRRRPHLRRSRAAGARHRSDKRRSRPLRDHSRDGDPRATARTRTASPANDNSTPKRREGPRVMRRNRGTRRSDAENACRSARVLRRSRRSPRTLRRRQLLAEAETAAGATDGSGSSRAEIPVAELDDFMTDCTAELVKYAEELRETCAEANERDASRPRALASSDACAWTNRRATAAK